MGILKLLLNCCVAATVCGLGSCMKKAESTENPGLSRLLKMLGVRLDWRLIQLRRVARF